MLVACLLPSLEESATSYFHRRSHRPTTFISTATTTVMLQLLLVVMTTTMIADAAGVHCPTGEITTALVFNDSQHYYISDCKVHNGGSVTVTNGSLFLERVELVSPIGGFSGVVIYMDGTSSPINFTIINSVLNFTTLSVYGPLAFLGGGVNGPKLNYIKVSNNRFMGVANIYSSDLYLGEGSLFEVSDNDLSLMGQWFTTSHLNWCLVQTCVFDGGRIHHVNNNGARPDDKLRSVLGDIVFLGIAGAGVKVLNTTNTPTIITFSNNTGFFPAVLFPNIDYAPDAQFALEVTVTNNSAHINTTYFNIAYVDFTSASITVPTSTNTNFLIYNNSVHILWSWATQDPKLSFFKCYACDGATVLVEENTFIVDVKVPVATNTLEFANVLGYTSSPVIARFISNIVVFVVPSGQVSALTGIGNQVNFHSTIENNHFNFSSSGGGYFSTVDYITGYNATLIETGNTFVSNGTASSFLQLILTDFALAPGHELRLHGNTIVLLSPPSVPPLIDFGGFKFSILPSESGLPNPTFTVTSNVIGSSSVCDADTTAPFGNFTEGAASLTATGCLNKICDVNILSLVDKYNYENVSWSQCYPTPTATPSISHNTTHSVTRSYQPVLIVGGDLGNNRPQDVIITRYDPAQPSVPFTLPVIVGAVAVTGTVVGAGTLLDAISSLQIWAIYSQLTCRIDGEQSSVAKRLLAPLSYTDNASSSLIGSLTLIVVGCGLYFIIVLIVFAIVRSNAPKAGDPDETASTPCSGNESADPPPPSQPIRYTDVTAAAEIEQRLLRAKLFLMYPRLPTLFVTALFTGIVFDSFTLLYGFLSFVSEPWEKGLAGVCVAAAVIFIFYHVWAGYAMYKAVKSDRERSVSDDDSVPTQCNDDTPPQHPGTPSVNNNDGGDEQLGPTSHSDASNNNNNNNNSCASQGSSIGVKGGDDDNGFVVAEDRPSDVSLPMSTAFGDRDVEEHHPHLMSTISSQPAVKNGDSPLNEDNAGVEEQHPMSTTPPLELVASADVVVDDPHMSAYNNNNDNNSPTPRLVLSPKEQDLLPPPLFDEEMEELAVDTTLKTDKYWTKHTEAEMQMQPKVLAVLLVSDGRWMPTVARSVHSVVTSMRPGAGGCLTMTTSSLVRTLAVCAVGAIRAESQWECDTIHGVLAFISFAHALLLLLLRSYRIPLINPMYAAQSVFLGLLACSQFIGSDEARTAFSVLFMVACGLAVVTCVIAAFLEFRIHRSRNKRAGDSKAAAVMRFGELGV